MADATASTEFTRAQVVGYSEVVFQNLAEEFIRSSRWKLLPVNQFRRC
jgi:hypothetical protein